MTKITLFGLFPTLPDTSPVPRPPIDAGGLHEDYWILPDRERAVFVRPLRVVYRHSVCGLSTVMAQPLAETFASQPSFYSHTFCAPCRTLRPVREFHWLDDEQPLGA